MDNTQCKSTVQVNQGTYLQMHLIMFMNCILLSGFIAGNIDCKNTHSMNYTEFKNRVQVSIYYNRKCKQTAKLRRVLDVGILLCPLNLWIPNYNNSTCLLWKEMIFQLTHNALKRFLLHNIPTFTKTKQCLYMVYYIRKTCITEIVMTVNSFPDFSVFVLLTVDRTGKCEGFPIICHVGIQE